MLAASVLISNPTIDVDANITLRVIFLFSVFDQVLYFVSLFRIMNLEYDNRR
jgi:hypothetical protein